LLEVEVDFGAFGVPKQSYTFSCASSNFEKEIAPARTFTFVEMLNSLKKAGLVKGGSLQNALVYDKGKVLNEEGTRFEDEVVRHKLLDCIGDFALGGIIHGHYIGSRPGHDINNKLLRTLFSRSDNYQIIQ